ncbi:LPXTG cell wall anchor domain-containing protein [Lentzea sp. NPDC054927]
MASRVLGAFVVAGTAALATLVMATPASAHTADGWAKCDGKDAVLHVDLTQFAPEKKNTVVIMDGDKVLVPTEKFGSQWSVDKKGLNGKVAHTFTVDVKAYDTDKSKGRNYDKHFTYTTTVCDNTPPKPEEPKPPQPEQPGVPTQPEVPSSSVTPPSSSTPAAPAPGGSTPEPPLAATGASPLWLLLSGLGLVGAGAGTLLFLRRRRSA